MAKLAPITILAEPIGSILRLAELADSGDCSRSSRMESKAAVNLIGSYNYALVALSVLIAMFASVRRSRSRRSHKGHGRLTSAVWLLGGPARWDWHLVHALPWDAGVRLPVPMAYHWPTVLLSLLAAILASVVAPGRGEPTENGALPSSRGSVLMGAGIASMHYIGMAAMRLPATCQFDSYLVVMSVVFAVLISFAALWITFHFRMRKRGIGWEKLAGAVVMGAAIPVMHYTVWPPPVSPPRAHRPTCLTR